MSKTQVNINKETNEISFTREFDAPIQLVWEAFTKPELINQWWGPKAFSNETREMDVRPGGTWYYVMHGTGAELKGTQFENMEAPGKVYYEQVEEPNLIVYRDVFVDKDGNDMPNMPQAQVTYLFEEVDGKTRLTSTTKYETLEELEKVISMGMEQGMSESLEKLEELLAKV